MWDLVDKAQEMLSDELKDELKKIIDAKKYTPENVKTLNEAVCLMNGFLDLQEKLGGENSYGTSHMNEGYSTRRGRSMTTGRYVSRDRDPMMSYQNETYGRSYDRSYDRGYSGHSIKDRMIAKLEGMYDEAKSEHERQVVDEWINRLESSH